VSRDKIKEKERKEPSEGKNKIGLIEIGKKYKNYE
jgi:hypothetical protein